ncbi:hypothetical protein [uncultured Bifidobacterium sp.]|uniref:hypothetical protein n=1 Tax=uncultured Bifidobacterium sp. TaxID=165187 RepID=UPI0026032FBE|nr:hypothetical protein [uncultured Bifidobacterium sp.]
MTRVVIGLLVFWTIVLIVSLVVARLFWMAPVSLLLAAATLVWSVAHALFDD